MKKIAGVVLSLILLGLVVASGCLGGGRGATSTTPPTHTTGGSSPTGTTGSPTTTPPGTTTTSGQATGTTTSSPETPTSTETPGENPTTTTTQTPAEEAYWEHPWEYAPVTINGKKYLVTYYKIHYKVQPNQSSPVYEYIVEKSVEKTKVHVYGTDLTGGTVDLGEHGVYEYTTVVTPIKAAELRGKLVLKVWYKEPVGEAFIYPWDAVWATYFNPYGSTQVNNFVGMEMDYEGQKMVMTNGAAFKTGLFPHLEGSSDWMNEVKTDLNNLYMGWFAVVHVAIWNDVGAHNMMAPQSGAIADSFGHKLEWSSNPDGTVTFSEVAFKLVDFQWKYSSASGDLSAISGKGKLSPYLFMPVEVDGHVSYLDEKTGESTTIYGYMKIEDLKLEKVD
ncbi:hypothetical protein [Thermococcus sp.]|uniref:hypothetical protein n=1 Tax=Thermococcus sp. TaxID=35749 RepID=UPI00260D7160|nr:hypothetical protein [Thermococcus sp.]